MCPLQRTLTGDLTNIWINRSIQHLWTAICQENPCIQVTGMRQSGKTALLEHMLSGINFISLDLPRNAEEAENSGEQFLDRLGGPYLFL